MAPEQKEELRRRFADGGITMAALAREYNINYGAVWRAVHYKDLPELTPAQRALRARMAAFALHSQGKANTAAGLAAAKDRFEKQVDPVGTLEPAERARRAEYARKSYMAGLALASSRARAAHKGEDTHAQKLLTADRGASLIDRLRRQAIYRAERNRHELGPWQPVAVDGALAERAQCRVCRCWVAISDALPPRPPAGEVIAHDCYALQRRYRGPYSRPAGGA